MDPATPLYPMTQRLTDAELARLRADAAHFHAHNAPDCERCEDALSTWYEDGERALLELEQRRQTQP